MIDLGTSARFFKDKKIQIGYYNAPITNLNGFKYGKELCKACNTEQKLFAINPNRHPDPVLICMDCLASIKIESSHDTAFGFVDLNLPESLQDHDAKKHVEEKYYFEMIRTPSYLTLQGEQWMCHCNDFMDYIGTWEAPDFTRESKDGNGKNLFKIMTIDGYHNLWDDCELADDEEEDTWEDCLYHVFECRHCKVKHGQWEH